MASVSIFESSAIQDEWEVTESVSRAGRNVARYYFGLNEL